LGDQENQEIPLDQRDLPNGLDTVEDVSNRNETETIRLKPGKIRGICSVFVPVLFVCLMIALAVAFGQRCTPSRGEITVGHMLVAGCRQ
jgi:hypothetical protein